MFGNRRRRPNATEVAEVHRANLLKNVERRLAAAREKGDDSLVRQLEAEAQYLR